MKCLIVDYFCSVIGNLKRKQFLNVNHSETRTCRNRSLLNIVKKNKSNVIKSLPLVFFGEKRSGSIFVGNKKGEKIFFSLQCHFEE